MIETAVYLSTLAFYNYYSREEKEYYCQNIVLHVQDFY